MGRSPRVRPARLAEKLRQVRLGLGLSQSQMLRRLGDMKVRVYPSHISEYESGRREPPVIVLLEYSRAAGVPVELLIDDAYNLPEHLPAGSWVLQRGKLWQQRK